MGEITFSNPANGEVPAVNDPANCGPAYGGVFADGDLTNSAVPTVSDIAYGGVTAVGDPAYS